MYSEDDFYAAYRKYLAHPVVRQVHDEMFRDFTQLQRRVGGIVDLGCATCEFGHYLEGSAYSYAGIDLNLTGAPAGRFFLFKGDYTSDAMRPAIDSATAFVSLFSTEIHYPYRERQAFYRSLFDLHPKMKAGMVSGLVYDGHETEPEYTERLGFRVYQSVEPAVADETLPYHEFRCLRRVPPGMFGDSFTEVWKIFIRKGQ